MRDKGELLGVNSFFYYIESTDERREEWGREEMEEGGGGEGREENQGLKILKSLRAFVLLCPRMEHSRIGDLLRTEFDLSKF